MSPVPAPDPANELTIRPLQAQDMPAVMRIQAACYSAIVPESPQSMGAKLRAAPAFCHGAWRGEVLVGYLLTLPLRGLELPPLDAPTCTLARQPDALYLHDLALSPAARGSGAGQMLVQAALTVGVRRGLRQALLVAIQGSRPYWQRQGFAVLDDVPAATQAKLASYGADARLMRRDLP